MNDSRQADITKEWCEVIWARKYGLKHPWGPKEAKLLQVVIRWLDGSIKEPERVKESILGGLRKYIEERNEYYAADKHPFSKFASKKERWCAILVPQRIAIAPARVVRKITRQEFEQWMVENPARAIRAFKLTGGLLKKINLSRYHEIRDFLIDLVGKDRAREIAIQDEGIVKSL